MSRKSEIVEFLEGTRDREERIRMAIGPCVVPGVRILDVSTMANKLDAQEAVTVSVEFEDPGSAPHYVLEQNHKGQGFPVVFSSHMAQDVHIAESWRPVTGGHGLALIFTQDSHPHQLDHEQDQEARYRKMQHEAGIPFFAMSSTRGERREP